jgi:tRNA-splicing ligase RtcB (3'-phosphate/5'-hydroxy nucleic acid ligase)
MKILSSEKLPIKIWTDVEKIEPHSIQQLKNMANMPFVFKHVAVMPDVHFGLGATIGSVIAMKGAIIPAAVGVDLGCFTGDTKIPLLDGTQENLKNLSENGKEIWIYSISMEGKIVPGKAVAIKTRSNAELLEIRVSGGEIIRCTPDHQFLLLEGKYLEAEKLKVGTSLMPLYRSYETRDGYEKVFHPGTGKGEHTHRLIHKYFNGRQAKDVVIHHIDHTFFNNSPDNLQAMTASQHSTHHRKNTKNKYWQSKEFEEKRVTALVNKAATEDGYKYFSERGTKNVLRYMKDRPLHYKESVKDNGKRGSKYLIAYNKSEKGRTKSREIGLRNKKNINQNHKVISIRKLEQTEDVYCLQVEKYHNFALSAGIFVHNCGMMAVKTKLRPELIVDNAAKIRSEIERCVPVGFNDNSKVSDACQTWILANPIPFRADTSAWKKASTQLGSLGGGNHFIEVCLDTDNCVWVMLHSGSRYIGKHLADKHINTAKDLMKKYFIDLPDPDLAYLAQGTQEFMNYIGDLKWAQQYAFANREEMMNRVLRQLSYLFNDKQELERVMQVNCHHNYIAWEHHGGQNVMVTRKGAVRARVGDMGIIPGSMGAKSFIVRGLGNSDSFDSCAHGAGRKMSRTQAKKQFSVKDLEYQTQGVECRKDNGVLDEIPGAYKNIDEVMENQKDLVEVIAELKQVLCIKG